jgi:hypothetical protein
VTTDEDNSDADEFQPSYSSKLPWHSEWSLKSWKTIVCNMYLEIHFLNSHLDFFPENLGTISDKNEEHFHQDISNMKSHTRASAAQVCW